MSLVARGYELSGEDAPGKRGWQLLDWQNQRGEVT
jgi:hypothetical protein